MDLFQVKLFVAAHRQGNVFGGGKDVHQLEVLVDHADAQVQRVAGGTDGDRLIVDVDIALIGEINTRDHIHQGGFAAAVLAQQGQNLAAAYPQRNILVGHNGTKGLGNVLQAYSVFGLRHGCRLLSFFVVIS